MKNPPGYRDENEGEIKPTDMINLTLVYVADRIDSYIHETVLTPKNISYRPHKILYARTNGPLLCMAALCAKWRFNWTETDLTV